MNFCQFIKNIQKDPKAIVPRLRISQLLKLQEHVKQCKECDDIANEVLDKYDEVPEENFKRLMGEN